MDNVMENIYVPKELTPRQAEVMEFLLQGMSNKEIVRAMGLELVTIKLHVRNICQKYGAKSRLELVVFALRGEGFHKYVGGGKYRDMDLLDWFAGQALSGFALQDQLELDNPWTREEIAEECYCQAEAMMKRRKLCNEAT